MPKILIIDDEEIIRKRLKKLLELDGFDVFTAKDGFYGIEIFKKEKPEIICVDIKMPGKDGIEVLREIKSLDEDAEVILITGHGGVDSAIEAMRKGAFGYLQKPIDYNMLYIDINRAIERKYLKIKLKEYVNNLENLVEDRTKELKLANEQLSKSNINLQREHEIGEEVFKNIRKANFFETPNMRYLLSPMSLFNGDILASKRSPSGIHNFMLGDFTGHGLAAAIGAIPALDIFYDLTLQSFSISEIISNINKKLKLILPTGIFLAACLIELDATNGIVKIWNGGIPNILILSNDGKIKYKIPSKHTPIGIIDNLELDLIIIKLEIFDRIYVYSDGLIESKNNQEEMFGEKRLENSLIDTNIDDGFNNIINCLNEFTKGKTQTDDITLLEIICDPMPYKDMKDYKHDFNKLDFRVNMNMSMILSWNILPKIDPSPLINKILSEIPGLNENKANILTVFSELYNNALDHGILKLDSSLKSTPEGFMQFYELREKYLSSLEEGMININLQHISLEKGGQLTITVEDSGQGFDSRVLKKECPENEAFYGRGIPLISSLCQSFSYLGRGNIAKAVYVWE
ncbi:MAG: SpoIIE family protein phosphatase [Desulfobacterales bacterium]|nr:SpoIIE family protein phosphatase [Desulfobacterales bacterium]